MRLNINLASQKYEDVRLFFIRWGGALAVLAALTLLLATLAVVGHSRSVKSRQEIKDLQQQVAALEKQREDLIAYQNRPENRDVTVQRRFWNSQIARRNLSWTQLFNDLQKIMPNRAYLNSVQPELTVDNRFKLKLVIAGEKREDSRELLKKMEDSPHFHAPKPVDESFQKESKGTAPTYRFTIETEYAPASAGIPPQTPPKRGSEGASQLSASKEAG